MNIVWEQPACTVKDVWQALNLRRQVARNTVLTLMTRLADKGWLTQTKCGRGFSYSATREKDQAQRCMARRLVNAAFGGSLNGLVMALIDDGELPASELDAIRETIAAANTETAQ
jgi:predicted transcriptional regulator